MLNQQFEGSGILTVLSRIHGPWAFVYWQVSLANNTLGFLTALKNYYSRRIVPILCGLVEMCLVGEAFSGICRWIDQVIVSPSLQLVSIILKRCHL